MRLKELRGGCRLWRITLAAFATAVFIAVPHWRPHLQVRHR
jgi:hypothetical protein